MKSTIFTFVFIDLSVVTRADDAKTVTKTSNDLFDIPKKSSPFEHLVETDSGIRTKYPQVIAPTHEEAGGRFSVGPTGFVQPSSTWCQLSVTSPH